MGEITGMCESELRSEIVQRLAAVQRTAMLGRHLVGDAAAACRRCRTLR